jgi:HEAT repeat protein
MIILCHWEAPKNAAILLDPEKSFGDRIGALFNLQVIGTLEAVEALILAFEKEEKSDFIRHQICFCLGQMSNGEEHAKRIL